MVMQTKASYKFDDSCKEKVRGESITVPDQSYSIQEVLEKFASGQNLNIGKDGSYIEDPDFDDYDLTHDPDIDIVDVQNEVIEIENRLSMAKQKVKEEEERQQEADRLKEEAEKAAASGQNA